MRHDVEGFERYLRTVRRCSDHTIRAYMGDVADYLAWIQGKVDGWAVYLGALDARYEGVTIRRKRAAVMAYCRYLYQQGQLSDVPHYPSPVRLHRRIPHFLSETQWYAVRQGLQAMPLRDQLMVTLTYSSGLRVGEVARLCWGDIDGVAATVRVVGKGEKERVVPMDPGLVPGLQQYYQTVLDRRATRGWLRAPVSSRLVQYVITRALAAGGLGPPFTPHSLRHTAAVQLLNAGATLVDVQHFLGHQTIHTTRHYAKTNPQRELEEAQRCHPRW